MTEPVEMNKYDKWIGQPYKWLKDWAVTAGTTAATGAVSWIVGPLKLLLKFGIQFTMDHLAKPIYDVLERYVVTLPSKIDNRKKTQELENATTKDELDAAIDNLK